MLKCNVLGMGLTTAVVACLLALPTYAGDLRVGIHDEVFARAILMDDGAQQAVLVVVEGTRVPNPQELAKAIVNELGVRESNVMLAATHTHNVLSVRYHGGEPDPIHVRDIERVKQGALGESDQVASMNRPIGTESPCDPSQR